MAHGNSHLPPMREKILHMNANNSFTVGWARKAACVLSEWRALRAWLKEQGADRALRGALCRDHRWKWWSMLRELPFCLAMDIPGVRARWARRMRRKHSPPNAQDHP
jgi:hypothetical protein